MKKLNVFLFATLVSFFFNGNVYAKWQIKFDAEANRVMYLEGDTLRGNFATKEQCLDYWKSHPGFEQNHSKCVGCDEQNSSPMQQDDSSQSQQDWERNASRENAIRQQRLREEAEYQEMLRQKEQKEQQFQEKFNQNKKEMLSQLKGGSSEGGLRLKGSGTKLMLKSGNIPTNNQDSAKEVELQQAKQRLTELRDDVSTMQTALRLYTDALLKNVSNLDRQAIEVDNMSDKILFDGIDYIRGIVTGRFLKSKFKFLKKGQKKKYDEFMKLVEKYQDIKEKKDLMSLIISSPNDAKILIEGADMLAGDVIPGWEHLKMNFKAWSTVGKECFAWRKISDTNRGTKEHSLAIKALSLRMEAAFEEINCLKSCIAESTANCINKCYQ